MPQPESGKNQPVAPKVLGPPNRDPDLSTDPGRSQPFESLYRSTAAAGGESHRPTARHYEPSLSPPEGQAESGDTFGWLYRRDPETEPPAADPQATVATQRVVGSEPPLPIPSPGAEVESGIPDNPSDSAAAKARRRWSLVVIIVVVALGLAAAAAVGLRQRASNQNSSTLPQASVQPSVGGSASASGQPSADGSSTVASPAPSTDGSNTPYAGKTQPLAPNRAVVDCQAPPSTDGAGRPVTYGPELMTDADLNTAWRCDGTGTRRTVAFSFVGPSKIAQVGLVNGYAKIDPKSQADRYAEYRRILDVTWTFPNGASFKQQLKDQTETLQTLRVPVQEVDGVTLTIDRSSKPGRKAKSRNAVLISEVSFGEPAR